MVDHPPQYNDVSSRFSRQHGHLTDHQRDSHNTLPFFINAGRLATLAGIQKAIVCYCDYSNSHARRNANVVS